MDNTKKNSKVSVITEWLLFAYLAIFPLGQLLRWDLNISNFRVTLHLADFLAGLIFLLTFFLRFNKPAITKSLNIFYSALFFSWFFSLTVFGAKGLLGGFYLIRVVAYSGIFLAASNLVMMKPKARKTLYKSLLVAILGVAILGWLQYLLMPDLRFLKAVDWDDHLFRLTGTFLDPGYTGILLVFGCLLALARFLHRRGCGNILLIAFFALSVAFTYSRASYVALAAGVMIILFLQKKIKWLILLPIAYCLLPIFLPRPSSEGVHLERLYSIFLRVENYRETLSVFANSPVFGVGFNNLCLARQKFIGPTNWQSHSCSGADSSLLFLLATGGVVGLITFIKFIIIILRQIGKDTYGTVFFGCGAAVLVHSFFANSLFYPWVMGFMGILLATALGGFRERT